MNLVLTDAMLKKARAEGLLRSCPECGLKHRVTKERRDKSVKCPECGTPNPPAKRD